MCSPGPKGETWTDPKWGNSNLINREDKTAGIIRSTTMHSKTTVLKAIFPFPSYWGFCYCRKYQVIVHSWLSIYDQRRSLRVHTLLSLTLWPPIIAINGSSQKDKPGWPVISWPKRVVKWVGNEMCESHRKCCKMLHSLNKWGADENWSHSFMRGEWNGAGKRKKKKKKVEVVRRGGTDGK